MSNKTNYMRFATVLCLTCLCISSILTGGCVGVQADVEEGITPAPTTETLQSTPNVPEYALPYGKRMDQRLKAFFDDNSITGLSAVIIDNGQTMFLNYGVTDGDGAAITENTWFEVGSITKTFTSVLLAAMSIEDETNIEIDSPVEAYVNFQIPEYEDGSKILFLHLATHTSGLPRMPLNYTNSLNPYADYTIEKLSDYFNSHSILNSKPGETYAYSNLGVGLMGVALTNAAGIEYDGSRGLEQLYKQYIWNELDMNDTALILTPQQENERAVPHTKFGTKSPAWDFDALAGCGAIKSTTADLAKYLMAAMGQRQTSSLLKDAFVLTQEERFNDGTTRIGLGFFILEYGGDTYFWHNGITGGYQSAMLFSPESGKGIAILCNNNIDVYDLAYKSLPYMK